MFNLLLPLDLTFVDNFENNNINVKYFRCMLCVFYVNTTFACNLAAVL